MSRRSKRNKSNKRKNPDRMAGLKADPGAAELGTPEDGGLSFTVGSLRYTNDRSGRATYGASWAW